jgi:hypothetical protein
MKDNLSDDLLLYGCFKVLGVDTKVRESAIYYMPHMSYVILITHPPLPPL